MRDYFEMMRSEASGVAYNKSEHNQALRRLLNGRSKSSVELKHQNISAVLDVLGLPYIHGYKPWGNSQLLLRNSVQAYVLKNQQLVGAIVPKLCIDLWGPLLDSQGFVIPNHNGTQFAPGSIASKLDVLRCR
ncbi:hypothetical protein [Pseudomonas aeruginosa]|uniref:hypothetical protein n=1 Tax=Pseudomonas aeruginosa TaxID=287 RepID=UPI0039F656C6